MTGKAVGFVSPAVSDLVIDQAAPTDSKRHPKTPAPAGARSTARKATQGPPHLPATQPPVLKALTYTFSSLPGPLLGGPPAVESPRVSGRTTRATTRLTGTPLADVNSGKSRFPLSLIFTLSDLA